MPLEKYNLDLENQRTQLQGDAISFIRTLLYKRKDKSIIPSGKDYEAVKLISSEIISREGDLDYFLLKYDEINGILTKLLSDEDKERVTLVESMLKIMAKLKESVDELMEEEFNVLSNSGGKRGKKTYKKRVRSRKTRKRKAKRTNKLSSRV